MGEQMQLRIDRTFTGIASGGPFNVIIDTKDVANISIQVITTGTPTGTFAWAKSNAAECDPASLGATSGTWAAFTPAGAPSNPAGSPAKTIFELDPESGRFILLTYTDGGSGPGTNLRAIIFGKGQG
jgi:hypothetical protein